MSHMDRGWVRLVGWWIWIGSGGYDSANGWVWWWLMRMGDEGYDIVFQMGVGTKGGVLKWGVLYPLPAMIFFQLQVSGSLFYRIILFS